MIHGTHNAVDDPRNDDVLFDVYGADEAFVTGTFDGLTPVTAVEAARPSR